MKNIVQTKSFEINSKTYGVIVIFLENAISIYVYDGEPKLGTIGLSIPGSSFTPTSTLHISGAKDQLFVQMIGERIATKMQKLILTSLNLKSPSGTLLSLLIEKIEAEIFSESTEINKK